MDPVPDPTPLREAALAAAARAYAPASDFPVGAAVLSEDGQIFAGCNVENASYGLTICAERAAVCAAVAAGQRRLRACFVHTPRATDPVPCGACCQVLAEFAPDDLCLFLLGSGGTLRRAALRDFLPQPFRFDALP